jgi:hypothetical protein
MHIQVTDHADSNVTNPVVSYFTDHLDSKLLNMYSVVLLTTWTVNYWPCTQ